MDINVLQTLIVGHLWQSVALAAVLAGALIFGRRMRGSTRYGLAGVAFTASLALPLAAFIPGEALVTGLMDRLNAPASLAEAAAEQKAAPTPVAKALAASQGVPDWITNLGSGVVRTAMPEGVPASETFWGKAAIEDGAPAWAINLGGAAIQSALTAPVAAEPPPAPMFIFPEIKLPNLNLPDLTLPLALVWLAGVALMLARVGRDLVAVEMLVSRAQPADLPEALKRRMKGVRVAISPEAPGPMAAGLFRPCIVLPETIALGSPGMAALLEHERAHIERRDMLAALGQRIVLALLWWSPALYWISRRIDEEREVACDETAVDRTGDAKAFARSLTIEAQNQLWARAPRLAVGAIGPRSQVGRRIKRLIEIAKGASPAKYAGRLAFAGLALAVAVAAMITPRFAADAQRANEFETAIDLLSQHARDQAREEALAGPRADDQEDRASRLRDIQRLDGQRLHGSADSYAALGEEIGALMEGLGAELELALAGLSPEMEAELAALSMEMAVLGTEIGLAVSDEMMANMPEIMEQVREELAAEGINIDELDDIQQLTEEDREELRQTMREARDEIREKLGPEMREEIRAAMEEARADIAEHKGEIRAAMEESRAGMEIAREVMAKVRAEIDAARARGDFDDLDGDHDFKFDFDFDFDREVDKEVIEKLKAKGISIDKSIRVRDGRADDALTPGGKLMRAASKCNDEEVRRLIVEDKANVNTRVDGDGTPLIVASRKGCIDTVRTLLNAGADANLASSGDGNPLIQAAARGQFDVAKLLLERGANVNGYVEGDETPLINAAERGELAIAELLVDSGAKVNLAYNVESAGRAPERNFARRSTWPNDTETTRSPPICVPRARSSSPKAGKLDEQARRKVSSGLPIMNYAGAVRVRIASGIVTAAARATSGRIRARRRLGETPCKDLECLTLS